MYSHEHGGISSAQNRRSRWRVASSSRWSTTTTSLNPAALRMVAAVIQEHPDADVIYTDEMSVDTSGGQLSLILKPDWSPEYLLAAHYFNHLTAYRRQLVTEAGGFNPDYELAQDWDLALRVTATTDRVHHIPAILYHWRRNPTSAGHDWESACYWRKRCHAEHVRERFGPAASSEPVWMDGFFWTHRPIRGRPLVSVIIPTMGARQRLRGVGTTLVVNCLRSLLSKTRYQEFEVICVVDPLTPRRAVPSSPSSSRRACASSRRPTRSTSRRVRQPRCPARPGRTPPPPERRHRGHPARLARCAARAVPGTGERGGRGEAAVPERRDRELRHRTRSRTARRHTVPWLPGHPSGPRRESHREPRLLRRHGCVPDGAGRRLRGGERVRRVLRRRPRRRRLLPPGAGGGLPDRDLSARRADALRGCESREPEGPATSTRTARCWSKATEHYWSPLGLFAEDYTLSCPTPSGVAGRHTPAPATIA